MAKNDRGGIVRADEFGEGLMRLVEQSIAISGGGECAAMIRIGVGKVMADRLDHALRNLGPAWAIKEDCGAIIDLPRQRRELPAAVFDEGRRECHDSCQSRMTNDE